jgi:hypothetical protein
MKESFGKLELIEPKLIHGQVSSVCAQYGLNVLCPIEPQRAALECIVADLLDCLDIDIDFDRVRVGMCLGEAYRQVWLSRE